MHFLPSSYTDTIVTTFKTNSKIMKKKKQVWIFEIMWSRDCPYTNHANPMKWNVFWKSLWHHAGRTGIFLDQKWMTQGICSKFLNKSTKIWTDQKIIFFYLKLSNSFYGIYFILTISDNRQTTSVFENTWVGHLK